jgi:hypothetical protein
MRGLVVCTALQYYVRDTSRKMGMTDHVESMRERRAVYRVLLVKTERKRPG